MDHSVDFRSHQLFGIGAIVFYGAIIESITMPVASAFVMRGIRIKRNWLLAVSSVKLFGQFSHEGSVVILRITEGNCQFCPGCETALQIFGSV